MFSPLTACRPPSADKTNGFRAFGKHYSNEASLPRKAEQYEPFFIHRVSGIVRDPTERIAEDRGRFLE